MRVLFLLHQFYPTCQFGAETYAYHLGQGLRARGHEVHVFHRENHVARRFGRTQLLQHDDLDVDGLAVRRVFLHPGYVLHRGAFYYFLTTFYNPPIEEHFDRYLSDIRPDIVHVHHLLYLSSGLVRIAARRGIPVVATLHDFWYFCANAQLLRPDLARCDSNPGKIHCARCLRGQYGSWTPSALLPLGGPWFMWRDRVLRRAMSRVGCLLAPSRFLLERHVSAGFERARMSVLDYDLAPSQDVTSTPPERPRSPVRVGYVGSLTRHKGVHVLVQAFRGLPPGQATLDVHGSPDDFPDFGAELRALAAGDPAIRFRGPFANERVDAVMRELDLLVVPSLWYENSPVVIREAFASRLPVLASRLGSLPEKVPEGLYGALFEPGDAADLHRALDELTRDRGLLQRLSLNLDGFATDFESHLDTVLGHYAAASQP